MNKFNFTLFLVIVLCTVLNPSTMWSQESPVAKLKRVYKVRNITFDKQGIPRWLDGNLTPKGVQGDAKEKTYKFFEENKDLYKMQNPANELKVISVVKDPDNRTYIRLKQLYKGIDVYGSELITHFNEKNELETVNGDFLTGITISVTPAITQEVAEKKMMNELHAKFVSVVPEVQTKRLLIYPFENKVYLTWHFVVRFGTPVPGWWEYFVDALNGNIIYKADRMRWSKPIGKSKENR